MDNDDKPMPSHLNRSGARFGATRSTPQAAAPLATDAAAPKYRYTAPQCALFLDDNSVPLAGAACNIPTPTRIELEFVVLSPPPTASPWVGFRLKVPHSQLHEVDNEIDGFGFTGIHVGRVDSNEHKGDRFITIRLPHGQYDLDATPPESSHEALMPSQKRLCTVTIRLHQGARCEIRHWGIPYRNISDPTLDAIVNNDAPFHRGLSLLDIFLRGTKFKFAALLTHNTLQTRIKSLPPPFMHPYGTRHEWNLDTYRNLTKRTAGPEELKLLHQYDSMDDFLAIATQFNVRNVLRVHHAAAEIAMFDWPAYFVGVYEEAQSACIIVSTAKTQHGTSHPLWRRLIKTTDFKLVVHPHRDPAEEERIKDLELYQRKIMVEYANDLRILRHHNIEDHELLLQVELPSSEDRPAWLQPRVFDSRTTAYQQLRAKGRVDALQAFADGAQPCGISTTMPGITVGDQQALHRGLLQGIGFAEWMTTPPTPSNIVGENVGLQRPAYRQLPSIDFTATEDTKYLACVLAGLLPNDRHRFKRYLSDRPLGLGLITGGAGFGKTELVAVAALIMQAKLGPILCVAPDVAVNAFAERIDRISARATDLRNQNPGEGVRQKLVVHGSMDMEVRAFMAILQKPQDGSHLTPGAAWALESAWHLKLSVTYWLLVVFGFDHPEVEELSDIHPKALHDIRIDVRSRGDLVAIRAWAAQKPERAELPLGSSLDTLRELMRRVVDAADEKMACGLAVDDASKMSRTDLLGAWGNRLAPCFLAGDTKQVSPVIAGTGRGTNGLYTSRRTGDGQISLLELFEFSGMPVYRTNVQLRAAEGLYLIPAKTFYPEMKSFTYVPDCTPALPKFKLGQVSENFIAAWYHDVPSVKRPPPRRLSPLFINCMDSLVEHDPRTGQNRSKDQVRMALDFARDFIKSSDVTADKITFLAHHAANVDLIDTLKSTEYAQHLANSGPASTVDAYQGRDNGFVIVVMGTNGAVGPGFTADPFRLNTMMSRAKSGLVIVGDFSVLKDLDINRSGKLEIEWDGETVRINVDALLEVYSRLKKSGGVANVTARGHLLPPRPPNPAKRPAGAVPRGPGPPEKRRKMFGKF
ncbi:hypothetical protein F5X68DRAFT_257833 [Plectosphaerella plurivora]|uniref:DNA2/NAM7 helicase-like C-terminal domain-containing protein n=1 Tax=Plectosphaerella plurivora TaxID=936078 RepID=A0A9P8VJI0_9PEZI|nr:hypothetical protein F5X68DRAFT_257833 [Plectosphaerella plurivora]